MRKVTPRHTTIIRLKKSDFQLVLEGFLEKAANLKLDKFKFQTSNSVLTYMMLKIRSEGAIWILQGTSKGGEIEFYHLDKTRMGLAVRSYLVKKDKTPNVQHGILQLKRKLKQAILHDKAEVNWDAFDKAFFLLRNIKHPTQTFVEKDANVVDLS